jgi:hypothetical protein
MHHKSPLMHHRNREFKLHQQIDTKIPRFPHVPIGFLLLVRLRARMVESPDHDSWMAQEGTQKPLVNLTIEYKIYVYCGLLV